TIRSILRPDKVKFLSLRNEVMPSSKWMPPAASGPVFTVSRPILSGAPCAIDGLGKAAAPAAAEAPATKRRRVVLIIKSSRGSAVLVQPECLNALRAGGIQSHRREEANP